MKKLLATAVAVAFAIGLACGTSLAEDAPKVVYGKKVGDIAQPVKLKDVEGKEFDTGEVVKNDKAFFLIFNSVCNICQAELRDLDKNYDSFAAAAKLYLVVVDMNLERAMSKYQKYGEKFKILHDPDFLLGDTANLSSTPSTLILDKGGKILLAKSGYKKEFPKEYMEALK